MENNALSSENSFSSFSFNTGINVNATQLNMKSNGPSHSFVSTEEGQSTPSLLGPYTKSSFLFSTTEADTPQTDTNNSK